MTGTVTYDFFATGDCSGSPTTETVGLGNASCAHGPLASGGYAFHAGVETKGLDKGRNGCPTTNWTGPLTSRWINASNDETGSCPLSVVKAMAYLSLSLGANRIARLL
jgi:hypothetical protein